MKEKVRGVFRTRARAPLVSVSRKHLNCVSSVRSDRRAELENRAKIEKSICKEFCERGGRAGGGEYMDCRSRWEEDGGGADEEDEAKNNEKEEEVVVKTEEVVT